MVYLRTYYKKRTEHTKRQQEQGTRSVHHELHCVMLIIQRGR